MAEIFSGIWWLFTLPFNTIMAMEIALVWKIALVVFCYWGLIPSRKR